MRPCNVELSQGVASRDVSAGRYCCAGVRAICFCKVLTRKVTNKVVDTVLKLVAPHSGWQLADWTFKKSCGLHAGQD